MTSVLWSPITTQTQSRWFNSLAKVLQLFWKEWDFQVQDRRWTEFGNNHNMYLIMCIRSFVARGLALHVLVSTPWFFRQPSLNLPKVSSNSRSQVQVNKKTFFTGYMDWCRGESCLIFSPTYPGETLNVKLHYEQRGKFNLQRFNVYIESCSRSLWRTQHRQRRRRTVQNRQVCLSCHVLGVWSYVTYWVGWRTRWL